MPRFFIVTILIVFSSLATAEPNNALANFDFNSNTAATLAIIAFLPALVLAMTAFVRVYIILVVLRQAIGLVSAPSNQILIGISLCLTYFIMNPVISVVQQDALFPFMDKKISWQQAIDVGEKPIKQFMLKNTRNKDLQYFQELAQTDPVAGQEPSFAVAMTAFITSELRQAFQIGFMIYIPFLVVDILISCVLMSLGMIMASPLAISLPFKLLLFVLADGWSLLFGAMITSFKV